MDSAFVGLCPSTIRPGFPVLVFELSKLQNRTRRKRVEYCFREENKLSLTEFWGKLGGFCEKLGEFALVHK